MCLLWPLLRTHTQGADRAAYDISVFQDQLRELERDTARGLIGDGEAEAARTEIQRRLIAAGKLPQRSIQADSPMRRAVATAVVGVMVPFAALGTYFMVGAPQLAGTPSPQIADASHDSGDVAALVEQLATRMRENPQDPHGWILLARSYRQLERFGDAADAYRRLMALQPDNPEAFSGFGEVATIAANGVVSVESLDAFIQALGLDRDDLRAQFYVGIARAQTGDAREAIAIWREMTASAPEGAAWAEDVREQMAHVVQEAGILPMTVPPRHALDVVGGKPAAGPTEDIPSVTSVPAAPDVSALKGRFSDEQLNMIQGMVGGLAARLGENPNDYDGWMRLGRAYAVLENSTSAKDAYAEAIALKPGETAPKVRLAEILAREGDTAGAHNQWQAALDILPADAPDRAEIQRRMEALQ